jgi:MoxR-like ATPase
LPDPFLVIATQNPVELEGTFPLPEAQLDRFLFLLNLGYPDADDEDTILKIHGPANVRAESLEPILSPAAIATLRDEVRAVRVGDAVRRYAVEIVRGTRRVDGVDLGASPRAALALYRAAQAHAAIRGRAYVLPDDVKAQTVAVLRHRLFLSADAEMRGRTTTAIIAEVLARTPVPAEDVAATAG